jgi:ribonuclease VapC
MTTLILETSALVAILLDEPLAPELMLQIEDAEFCLCPTNCVVETIVVLVRKGRTTPELARNQVLDLLQSVNARLMTFDETAMHAALQGYSQYGKGTGKPPALLNFGDCLSYGAAKAASGKLLYTGQDFTGTDLA